MVSDPVAFIAGCIAQGARFVSLVCGVIAPSARGVAFIEVVIAGIGIVITKLAGHIALLCGAVTFFPSLVPRVGGAIPRVCGPALLVHRLVAAVGYLFPPIAKVFASVTAGVACFRRDMRFISSGRLFGPRVWGVVRAHRNHRCRSIVTEPAGPAGDSLHA